MSVREQYRLLSVPRGTLYYRPSGTKAEDLSVMCRLDELYTTTLEAWFCVRALWEVL